MAAGNNFWDFQQNLKGKNSTADPASPPAKSPEKPLTVSQLTSRIERALKSQLPATLHVRGEVSNFKQHNGSGHLYFTLKDPSACIDCVMFRSEAMSLKFTPADGLELIATGRVGVFAQRGKYQFYVTALQPLGQGALELARQQIQNKLQAEGLFHPDRKRPLPRYPRRIVLLTSAQTAAVQDMLKVLGRFPFLHVQVYHVQVQGEGSAQQITTALQHLNKPPTPGSERKATTRILPPIDQIPPPPIDLILLSRGGGSLEDLWEFNEEILARAISASRIPIVTGIGHEIDVSIADLVADHHAHTPTEAAQVATQHWRTAQTTLTAATLRLAREMQGAFQHARQRLLHIERHELFRRPLDRVNQLRQLIDDRQRALSQSANTSLRHWRDQVTRMDSRLRERHPRHLTALAAQKITALAARLQRATAQSLQSQTRRIDLLAARLHAINPAEVLKRGYSLTTHKKTGQIIKDPNQVKPGDTLLTRLANGQIESQVRDTRQLKLFD